MRSPALIGVVEQRDHRVFERGLLGLRAQRCGRGIRHHDTLAQHDDPAREWFEIGDGVAGDQHRAVLRRGNQVIAQLAGLDRIHPAGRLVEHEQRRIAEQRVREADALAIPFDKVPIGRPASASIAAAARQRSTAVRAASAPRPFCRARRRR